MDYILKDNRILDIEPLVDQVVQAVVCSTYWLSPSAAEVGWVKGLDLHALLTRRPQPAIVVVRAAAVLLPAAPERMRSNNTASRTVTVQCSE